MRVLHFYKTYFPQSFGGAEQAIYQLARGMGQRSIEVDVLSLSRLAQPDTIRFEDHAIHHVRQTFEVASTGFALGAFAKFRTLARKADVVHYHFPWPFADVVHFATRPSKPTVLTYHSDIVRQQKLLPIYAPLMRRFLGSMDRIVVTSPNYLATSDVLKAHRDKVEIIPIGLDQSTYPTPDAALLDTWNKRLGRRFFLFVGVLRYYKGLHILLEAVRGAGYSTIVVGAGPIEAELREHAAAIGVDNVHFLGALSDLDKAALLELCHAVVFPSHLRSEAFGISLLEGAMHGKPMISSEIGTGTSYINIHRETGLVVPAADPIALRNAMDALHDNPDMAAEMGRRAHVRYLEYFTADQMVDRHLELYRELIARHRPG